MRHPSYALSDEYKGKGAVEEEHPTYHIYLLTVWQERPNAYSPQWRFRLVDPQTGFDRSFVTLQALPYVLQQLRSKGQNPAASDAF